MDPHDNLRECLQRMLHTDHEQILDELACRTQIVQAPKGTTLFREGELIEDVYFLKEGIVRMFYTDASGEEITEWINYRPGTVIIPTYSLSETIYAKASGETLTDSELVHIPLSSLMEVAQLYPEFDQIRICLLQSTLERQTILKRTMTHKTPSERYAWMVENHANLIERIPQKYLASLLGMTPVSLSRIRSRYRDKQTEE